MLLSAKRNSFIWLIFLMLFTTCKLNDRAVGKNVSYKMLEDSVMVSNVLQLCKEQIGSNIHKVNAVKILVSRPSMEGMIKRASEKDFYSVAITYQNPLNAKGLVSVRYSSDYNMWTKETMDIQVYGGKIESYKLEDELFDFTAIDINLLLKAIKNTLDRYQDNKQFLYQYIHSISIKKEGLIVGIKGILKLNVVEKSQYVATKFDGTIDE